MAAGIRPLAYVPVVTDVGLRTERVDVPDCQAAERLGVSGWNGRLIRHLSSGERQRVRLVSALSPSTRFAAFDEPCRHLDPHLVDALNALLATRVHRDLSLAACDSRGRLDGSLFDWQHGSPDTHESACGPCPPPQGDPLRLEIPNPFLLSASGRPTSRQPIALERGALVVVTGPNGSGKTSLIEATARAARVAGRKVGISRQEPEHQAFAASLARELGDVAAVHPGAVWCDGLPGKQVSFERLIANLGLEPWRDWPVPRLPLGVLSLLGAAIALWIGKDLVLLDEPTQGLDTATARRLGRELVRCAEAGARLIVASHDPELVRLANGRWTTESGILATGDVS